MTTLAGLATNALLAGALLAGAWLVDRAVRRRVAPQVLTLVWFVALLRLVLPNELASPASVTAGLGASSRAAARTLGDAPEWLFGAWLVGAVALLTLRIVQRFRLHSSLGAPVQLAPDWSDALANAAKLAGLRRLPSVHAVELTSPAVTGLWRPKLLLPASALERAPNRDDTHALLHELTHLRRRDLLLDEAVALLRCVFWFQPLVWLAAVRLHELSELACDADVATRLGRTSAYRATLVRAALSPAPTAALPARAFLSSRPLLLRRLDALERPAPSPLARRVALALALACAAVALPMATPRGLDREHALATLADAREGAPLSCFHLQAAALVLSADPLPHEGTP
ncbi:MAG: M56 family metallopeptidase [Planctomycetota bacterium]|nr:M56 family metallopeptidase [Planctomycetota bacterium]